MGKFERSTGLLGGEVNEDLVLFEFEVLDSTFSVRLLLMFVDMQYALLYPSYTSLD